MNIYINGIHRVNDKIFVVSCTNMYNNRKCYLFYGIEDMRLVERVVYICRYLYICIYI